MQQNATAKLRVGARLLIAKQNTTLILTNVYTGLRNVVKSN